MTVLSLDSIQEDIARAIVIPVGDALTKEADNAEFYLEDDLDEDDIIFAMTYIRKSIRV